MVPNVHGMLALNLCWLKDMLVQTGDRLLRTRKEKQSRHLKLQGPQIVKHLLLVFLESFSSS